MKSCKTRSELQNQNFKKADGLPPVPAFQEMFSQDEHFFILLLHYYA
jgi:hypothetical protein